jgi:hypothetical protein
MAAPALGLGWTLWQRHRIGFCILGAYLLLLLTLVHGFPGLLSRPAMGMLMVPLCFGMLYLMGAFAGMDADLSATTSGYPTYLFTVPTRTGTLVFWPMFYATVTMALAWLVFDGAIVVPQGEGDLLWWPAAMFAALQACLLALAWTPVPLPNLRWMVAFVVMVGVVLLGVLGYSIYHLADGLLSMLYLAIVPIAGGVAFWGVGVARQGEHRERSWWPESHEKDVSLDPAHSKPFATAAQAQFWLEWKRNGLQMPLLALLDCLFLSVIGYCAPSGLVPLGVGTLRISSQLRLMPICLLAPLVCALIVGCTPRKSETFRKDLTLQPFLATRPLSSIGITLAKFRMAACSTLFAWGIVLCFLAVCLLFPAQDGKASGTMIGLLLQHGNLKFDLLAVVFLLGLIGWTWKNQVCGLYIEFTGRQWLITTYSIAFPLMVAMAIVWYFSWTAFHFDFVASLLRLAPDFALGWLLLKLLVAVWASALLRQRGMVSPKTLTAVLIGWLLLASGLIALLVWLLPSNLAPARHIALGVAICLPLARLLLTPLSLDWNRHR